MSAVLETPVRLEPREYARAHLAKADQYAADVRSGRQVAGRLVQAAVERQDRDLVDLPRRGYAFDPDTAARVFGCFAHLNLWEGRWAGLQFHLFRWQAWCTSVLFGWLGPDGWRRFRAAYLQVARKNGKTAWMGGLGLYFLTADREAGAQIYTIATKRDQARICHTHAVRMRQRSPALAQRIQPFRDNLSVDATASKFEPLGRNQDSMDGLNPHAVVADELHRHPDRGLWDVLEQGMGDRSQPMMLGISTAGQDGASFCYELREHSVQVLEDNVEDLAWFAFVAEPDKGDEWTDRATWVKGNPSLGEGLQPEALEVEFRRAASMRSAIPSFRRYRLDEWVLAEVESWLDMAAWKACARASVPNLAGRRAYGGLDLSATQDLTAFVLYLPAGVYDRHATVLEWYWVPEDRIEALQKHYRVPLEQWIADGLVEATPGNVVDYRRVQEAIETASEAYAIAEVGYDDWAATEIVLSLEEAGVSMVPVPQTTRSFNTPMAKFHDEVVAGDLQHCHNPATTWQMANVRTLSDPSGRTKPVKVLGSKRYKIDGPVAALMAKARALVGGAKRTSVYERRTRGLIDVEDD